MRSEASAHSQPHTERHRSRTRLVDPRRPSAETLGPSCFACRTLIRPRQTAAPRRFYSSILQQNIPNLFERTWRNPFDFRQLTTRIVSCASPRFAAVIAV